MSVFYKERRMREEQAYQEGLSPAVNDSQARSLTTVAVEHMVKHTKLEHRVDDRYAPQEETIDEIMRKELNGQQLRALEMILAGTPDRIVAHSLKMHRITVTRWRLYHPAFMAELNRRREAQRQTNADRLRQMTDRALALLEERLGDTTNPKLQMLAAMGVLRLAGTDRAARSIGPTSPDDWIEQLAYTKRRTDELGPIDNGEREDALLHLARRAESAMITDENVHDSEDETGA